jgi:hypothetical protein
VQCSVTVSVPMKCVKDRYRQLVYLCTVIKNWGEFINPSQRLAFLHARPGLTLITLFLSTQNERSRGGVVGRARLRAGRSGVRILVGARGFSSLALGVTQAAIQWVPGFFPGGKAAGA